MLSGEVDLTSGPGDNWMNICRMMHPGSYGKYDTHDPIYTGNPNNRKCDKNTISRLPGETYECRAFEAPKECRQLYDYYTNKYDIGNFRVQKEPMCTDEKSTNQSLCIASGGTSKQTHMVRT